MTGINSSSLSAKENTPEFQAALILAQNKWRWNYGFFTTWWHVVTKILEMGINYELPSGEVMYPFGGYTDVVAFFGVKEKLAECPSPQFIKTRLLDLHRERIFSHEKPTIESREAYFSALFHEHVKISRDDKLEKVLESIQWLERKDSEITQGIIADIQELIIYEVADIRNLEEWNDLTPEERSNYTLNDENIKRLFNYFIETMVFFPRRKRSNEWQEEVKGRVMALVQVSYEMINNAGGDIAARQRNTKYPK